VTPRTVGLMSAGGAAMAARRERKASLAELKQRTRASRAPSFDGGPPTFGLSTSASLGAVSAEFRPATGDEARLPEARNFGTVPPA
jgi:hypothetical protein